MVAVIAPFYSIATYRGRHATAGETLLGTRYLTQSEQDCSRVGLRRILKSVLEQGSHGSPSEASSEPSETQSACMWPLPEQFGASVLVLHVRQLVAADVAELAGADLVVLGSRRPCALGELVAGSVAHSVVHRLRRPVLLARRVPVPEPVH